MPRYERKGFTPHLCTMCADRKGKLCTYENVNCYIDNLRRCPAGYTHELCRQINDEFDYHRCTGQWTDFKNENWGRDENQPFDRRAFIMNELYCMS